MCSVRRKTHQAPSADLIYTQHNRDEFPLRRHQLGWSHMATCAQEHEVPRGFGPRSLESESRVLTAAPRDQMKFDSQEMDPLHHLGN
jgi:hypothetical protein